MPKLSKNQQYYSKNKDKYKKGGKYYTYVCKSARPSEIKIEKGTFVISFS